MTTSTPTTPSDRSSALDPLPAVTVESVELVRTAMPLVAPFTTAFGRQTARDVLLVHVRTAEAEGWGECVTPAAPSYSSEFTDGAELVLLEHLVPRALAAGRELDTPTLIARLAGLPGHQMARAALEAALLDAQLRAADRSLAEHLGAAVDRVPVGVSVGIPDGGVPELLDQVESYLDAGYLRVKAKIAPGADVAPVTALRERFGDDLALQVDANAGYDPDDPDHIRALDAIDELELVMLEQPFEAHRVRDHAHHAARWRTPVCLDESVIDAVVARDVIELGAAAIVNVKPGRVGGLTEAVRIHDVCRERNVPVWCGGMLETGIGRAANVALAALPGFTLPGDLSASDRYFTRDLTGPFVIEEGHLRVPEGPGIGRAPLARIFDGADITRADRRQR